MKIANIPLETNNAFGYVGYLIRVDLACLVLFFSLDIGLSIPETKVVAQRQAP